MASPTATGTARTMAMVDVTSVPKMSGRAPNRFTFGAHVRPLTKPNPNRASAWSPFSASTTAITIRRAIRPRANPELTPLNTRSPKRRRLRGASASRPRIELPSSPTPRCPEAPTLLRVRRQGFSLVGEVRDVLDGRGRHRARERREVQALHLVLPLRQHPLQQIDDGLRLVHARLVAVREILVGHEIGRRRHRVRARG